MMFPWREIDYEEVVKPWELRWTCPHCRGGSMTLRSAERHLRRRHYDCWSCRLERILVVDLARGVGWLARERTVGPA